MQKVDVIKYNIVLEWWMLKYIIYVPKTISILKMYFLYIDFYQFKFGSTYYHFIQSL